jgi:calcium/calmodulin-dependent protein kinase I
VVRLCTNKKNNRKFAVKIVERTGLPISDEEALRTEVRILKMMDSPHIVKCIDFFEDDKTFYVVMEFLEGGELFDRIVQRTVYSEKEARDAVYIILRALKYCHDLNIVHRDLKPENLLLKSKESDSDMCLADFGFAAFAPTDKSLTTQCGTPGYVAPEILSGVPYGKAVDMWSVGVITYIMLGGYPPFYDDNQKMLFRKIKAGAYEFHADYWKHVSAEAKDLIKNMLVVKPANRFTVEDALNHPWVGSPLY